MPIFLFGVQSEAISNMIHKGMLRECCIFAINIFTLTSTSVSGSVSRSLFLLISDEYKAVREVPLEETLKLVRLYVGL